MAAASPSYSPASPSYSSRPKPAFNPEDPKLYPWFEYESAFDPEDPQLLLAQFAPLDLDESELYTPTSPKYCDDLDPNPHSNLDKSEPYTPPTSPKNRDFDPYSSPTTFPTYSGFDPYSSPTTFPTYSGFDPYSPPTTFPTYSGFDPDPHSSLPFPSYSNPEFFCEPVEPCSARFRLCPDDSKPRAHFLGNMETKA